MPDLLSVELALAKILATIQPLASETISLENALGRTLAEDVTSDINLPPFANSSMDGFALQAADSLNAHENNGVVLRLVADVPAGTASTVVLGQGEAARIMTGAPLPDGADTVIPVENTDAQWIPGSDTALPPSVTIYRSLKRGDYIRKAGEDIRSGEMVVKQGMTLRAAELGLLAAIGHAAVRVYRQPRVTILSTGDELIDVSAELTSGKIRDSNSYTIAALVKEQGGLPIKIPTARDTLEDVRLRFREALNQQPDLIISSAGVSVGAFDVVRTVIDELGHVDFWKINLRPGKPLAYGHVGGVPFFGLPGNPVSAMVTFDVFVRPTLLKMARRKDDAKHIEVITGEDINSDGRRSYVRVKLKHEEGQWVARTTGTQSSGALSSMMLADGLLIIPEEVTFLPARSVLTIRLLRPLEEIG